jgi:lipoyl(octanoyl) transferase
MIETKDKGLSDYKNILYDMQKFVSQENIIDYNQIWKCQHYSVFTTGNFGKNNHAENFIHNIPLIYTDRGGDITYHGPGQLIIYFLFKLRTLKLTIKRFIYIIEESIILTLQSLNITGHLIKDLPGVYIKNKKICSIGLRVKNGYSYHGLSFNFNMDLTPFNYIDTCGQKDLEMTQLSKFIKHVSIEEISQIIINNILLLIL